MLGDRELEHGVAEELQALVVGQAVVLVGVRAMGQRELQQPGVLEVRALPGVEREALQQALRCGGLGGAAPARHQASSPFAVSSAPSSDASSNRPCSTAKRSSMMCVA